MRHACVSATTRTAWALLLLSSPLPRAAAAAATLATTATAEPARPVQTPVAAAAPAANTAVKPAAAAVVPAASTAVKPGAPALPPEVDLSFWDKRTDLIKPPPPPVATALALPQIMRWKLKNGLDVVVVPRPELPVVSFSMAVKAGVYDEDVKSLGVADFTASMLRKGTKARTSDEIALAIDFVGGNLGGDAGDEHSSAGCTALSKDSSLCLELLSDILRNPSFPDEEIPEVRDQILGGLSERLDSPDRLAEAHFANLVFGDEHPGGRVLTAERVKAITREDLLAFWTTYYRPNNSILAVAGAVNPATIKAEIEARFGSWQPAAIPARPAFTMPDRKGARLLLVDKDDLTQATLVFGHRGIRHADPSWYAATLMNYVLGGSDFSSRLMIEVRANRGLTYGINSSFGASLYDGAFDVSAATKNETAWAALMASTDELRKMKAQGPSEAELAKGRAFLAGSYPFKLQSAAAVAASIVSAELHGLGIAYVKQFPLRMARVDVASAKQAAAELLRPEQMVIVIVGRGDAIAPQITKAGVKFERIHFRDPVSYAERARQRKAVVQAQASGEMGNAIQMIRRGLQAQGGEANLRAIRDLKIVKSGVRKQGGVPIDMFSTTYFKRPDAMRVEQEIITAAGKGKIVFVVGPKGVKGASGGGALGPVPPVNEERLRAALFEDINFVVLNILDAKPALSMVVAPPLSVGDRALEGVSLTLPGGERTTLYFDARTHLLSRITSPGEGGNDLINDLDDYRVIGGVKFSHHQSTSGASVSEAKVAEIKVNLGIEAALFE